MYIFSNLATSVDGKIATHSLAHFPLGTPYDRKLMHILRKKSDAVLMGASTLRAFKGPLLSRFSKKQPINIILSSELKGISSKWKFFTEKSTKKIIFTTRKAPKNKIKAFQKICDVFILNSKPSTSQQIIGYLKRLKIKTLLVEGGGNVMWDFVSQNLIDKYYVTLTPRILGGKNAPTLVDGIGFEPERVLNLKLVSCRKIGHEIYLIYKKTPLRGP